VNHLCPAAFKESREKKSKPETERKRKALEMEEHAKEVEE
jgi:hypothetical protein